MSHGKLKLNFCQKKKTSYSFLSKPKKKVGHSFKMKGVEYISYLLYRQNVIIGVGLNAQNLYNIIH